MSGAGLAALRQHLDVSRETGERLEILAALVSRWTLKINLIAKSTVPLIWERHILDSAQMWLFRPPQARTWVDLGAGAGFPGLVVAALAAQDSPDLCVSLIESDTRKTVFLQTAVREMGLPTRIIRARIEAADIPPQDVISARALASVDKLLGLADIVRAPGAVCLFAKGAAVESELTEARASWHIDARQRPSLADSAGCILEILEFSRVGSQAS
jgi:16S rRNA (guanine527-N7)-methyltransferase